jgi:adenylate kinase
VTVVLYIKVAEQALLERLSGRWICRGAQQHAYHLLFNPPKAAGKCDVDGTALYQRDDDTADVQARRIKVFLEQTAPLIAFYGRRGQLAEVNGEQAIQPVTAALSAAVNTALGK